MDIKRFGELHDAIDRWCRGRGNLGVVCGILGDNTGTLNAMLIENGYVDAWGKLSARYSPQEGYTLILLFIAMRHG